MKISHKGEEVVEEDLFTHWSRPATVDECDEAIRLLLDHLKLKLVRTNATKHGEVELKLLSEEEEDEE